MPGEEYHHTVGVTDLLGETVECRPDALHDGLLINQHSRVYLCVRPWGLPVQRLRDGLCINGGIAQVGTLQRHLLKLGVLVKQTCRRVLLSFASHCPARDLWVLLLRRMQAAPT